jgi:hypothetical protein
MKYNKHGSLVLSSKQDNLFENIKQELQQKFITTKHHNSYKNKRIGPSYKFLFHFYPYKLEFHLSVSPIIRIGLVLQINIFLL